MVRLVVTPTVRIPNGSYPAFPYFHPPMKTDLSTDEQELLALLDPDQTVGNGKARQQLGWTE